MELIFGDPVSIAVRDKARLEGLEAMHEMYGMRVKTCKECAHFVEVGTHFYVCEKYEQSHPEHGGWTVVQWRKSWQACGAFEEPL